MSPRTWLVLFFAVMSGASAIIGISQMRANQAEKEFATVYMATKAVARGYQLRQEDIEPRRIPSNLVHEAMAKSLDDVVGRVAKISIFEGEFVLTTKLAQAGVKAGFASTIPSGLRAKSITAVSAADRVSGLLNVGDHVDVLMTHAVRNGSNTDSGITETLVQNVEVLAIDRTVESTASRPATGATSEKGDSKPSSVTLLVTPKEASILSLGQKEGTLSLSLRSPEDQTIVVDTDLLDTELYDQASPKKSSVASSLTSGGTRNRLASLDDNSFMDGEASDMNDPAVMQQVAWLVDCLPEYTPESTKYSAIRTIRGSSVGVVPVQVKSK